MEGEKARAIDQRFVKALAHPLRVAILDRLGGAVASPNQLSEKMALPLGNVAYHCRVLHKCGVLELVRTKQRRGATEHFFRAKPDAFIGANHWRTVPEALRAGASASALRELNDRAIASLEAGRFTERQDSTLTWSALAVDEEGWEELVEILNQTAELFARVHERSVERLGGADGVSVIVGVVGFEAAQRED